MISVIKMIYQNNFVGDIPEMISVPPNIKYIIKMIFTIILINFCIVISHCFLIRIYVYYCVPSGFYGMIYGIFTIGSPVCQTINSIQLSLSEHYMKIWLALNATIVTNIINRLKI